MHEPSARLGRGAALLALSLSACAVAQRPPATASWNPRAARLPPQTTSEPKREYKGVAPWPVIAVRSTGLRNGYFSGGAGLGLWGVVPQWAGVIAGAETGEGALARFAGVGWISPEGWLGAQLRFSWLHTRQNANGVGPDVEYRGVEVIGSVAGLGLAVTGYRRVGGLPGPTWRFALGIGLGF